VKCFTDKHYSEDSENQLDIGERFVFCTLSRVNVSFEVN
jgi:hypothetical protein